MSLIKFGYLIAFLLVLSCGVNGEQNFPDVCAIQSQVDKMVQGLNATCKGIFQNVVTSLTTEFKNAILESIQLAATADQIAKFKATDPDNYAKLLKMFGFIDNNGKLTLDPNAPVITDFCKYQTDLKNLLAGLPAQSKQALKQIYQNSNLILKTKASQIVSRVIISNLNALKGCNIGAPMGLITHRVMRGTVTSSDQLD